MTVVARTGLAALLLGCATALSLPSAHAMTVKECHEKFKEAKTANTLKGQSFKEFKASSCDVATTPASAAPKAATPATPASAEAPKPAKSVAATEVAPSNATLPSAVAPQYAKLSAGKARMQTCLDQYNANKASNANGGLKWIEKGGGYYSVCNKRLKGE
ncbi:MAG: hypothetical protein LKH76_04085 [Acetobacter fabarum]|jgi:hypothetical protein|uniref:Uncharacterized protein n=1 Tax=Acetobacter fabarum TaxID=483199 RepID=A0A269XY28_9PROT|nr:MULTISPECIES: hypothetical protein [Acetobacter]MCH4026196.1 hypothetical protein [Acetobacter fabarum]MCH4054945.1 hypothetical protein [Acetobacter fabarum]MCH4085942.1 hypothetical protein [Acetobacter fabarum]MCH4127466.1 hypothetical protein [Acetobacter fabarum]MCH4136815.1 hypothetical protein [Acetobacter fabarum]